MLNQKTCQIEQCHCVRRLIVTEKQNLLDGCFLIEKQKPVDSVIR